MAPARSTTRITSASAGRRRDQPRRAGGLSALSGSPRCPGIPTRGILVIRAPDYRGRAKLASAVRAPRWAKMTRCLAPGDCCLGCAGDIFPDWRIADRLLRRASLQRGLIDLAARFRTVAHAVAAQVDRPRAFGRAGDRPGPVNMLADLIGQPQFKIPFTDSRISAAWSRISLTAVANRRRITAAEVGMFAYRRAAAKISTGILLF